MANRSDFDSATLPRYLKRIMALTHFDNEHNRGDWKRMFIEAHKIHKASKNKRIRMDGPAVSESDVAENVQQ
jgi:hypothetical protein